MWYELFVIGSFWFWTLVGVEAIVLLTAVRHDNGWWATFSVFSFAFVMWLFGNFNVFSYIFHNPVFVLSCFSGYLLIGVGWSFGKWFLFNRAIKETYQRMKEQFLDMHQQPGTVVPENLQLIWAQYLNVSDHWKRNNDHWNDYVPKTYSIKRVEDITPKANDFKSDIIFWISYWPVSVLWSLLHDFVERMLNEIYNFFKGVYDNITRRMFQEISRDFESKP